MAGTLTWVIKSSKKCNLRCKYCYEFDDLDDTTKIAPNHFEKMFEKIQTISNHFGATPKLCWHGGEPLLLSPAYYEEAFSVQQKVFQSRVERPNNVIQTNLTIVGEKQLELLGKFDHVSISLDLFGGLRVAKNEKDTQPTVLRNLARLVNAGLSVGAISVLTKKNIGSIEKIFEFFNRANISFRLLPFYRSANRGQIDDYAISSADLLNAYSTILDLWFSRGNGMQVKPIDDCVRAAIIDLWGGPEARMKYEKAIREFVFVVDTNLDLYSVADTYDNNYRLGNLIADDAEIILNSDGRLRAVQESTERIHATCEVCNLHGACSGWPIGEATPIERNYDAQGNLTCDVIKPLINRAKEWLLSDSSSLGVLREFHEQIL